MGLEKLIKKCAQNDRKAQAEVYQLFSGKLFGLCLKYSKNYAEAQDNLQDGFITIFEKINTYNFNGSFEGWIKRIVINTALQKYRNKSMLTLVSEEIPDEVSIEIDEDTVSLEYLLSIIQQLPNRYRAVFNLYILDGYSHKEIAKKLDISEGTSKSNLSRARLILKEKLEENQSKLNTTKAQN
ncbi:RNA polymerase sigma factor [Urechidicola croceus]|uniref:RNA polymerase subunit sigma-70 n=1 Tax=Urechidicola croceus TaxID=1850246 RepID=A0A1D8P8X4_9FLAO|nr:sigma-70 family RNA polymerase sigma factor [Urechidicola croceus]AOW21036.1 RNA polymerase subunit sigma-70 [Urechidicola croceus]